MAKLHQIIAVEKDVRKSADRQITDGYQILQKPTLITGLTRTYQPKADEDTDTLPAETQRVQVRASEVLKDSRDQFERLWNVTATRDFANCDAKADVKLADGTVLMENVPVSYLLWLEKQLTDIGTIAKKLPMLDLAEEWKWSNEQDCYVTDPVETHRTKKMPRVLTKAQATDKHPAQVEVFQEDVIVGFWSVTKFSGALPRTTIRELIDRVDEVTAAVKKARAEANEYEFTDQQIAAKTLDYIFGRAISFAPA